MRCFAKFSLQQDKNRSAWIPTRPMFKTISIKFGFEYWQTDSPSTRIRIFFNPQLSSFGIRLPSTVSGECGIRIRKFWIHSPEWKFLNTLYEPGTVWTALNPGIFYPVGASQDRAQFSYREYSRRRRAQCYRFFTSWTSVSSLITCAPLNLTMITVHFNYAKRRLDILKRTVELDAINKINAK